MIAILLTFTQKIFMSKTAIILGATGLTGRILTQLLIKDPRYEKIKLFSRSQINIQHHKLEEHLIDVLLLENHADVFTGDEVFCCIGTTKAKTPNQNLYHKIDYGIPVAAAKLCKANKINTFIVVSAIGADANSSIFYNRTKGEMEDAIIALNIQKTHILQPSLIGGKRNEKRIGEYATKLMMKFLNPFLIGGLRKYRTIEPETIASAMIWLANHTYDKQQIISDKIKELIS